MSSAFIGAAFAAGLILSTACAAQDTSVPADRSIREGKIVLVDDGSCPAGQIKEITGGNKEKSIPRKTRCVPREPAAPR